MEQLVERLKRQACQLFSGPLIVPPHLDRKGAIEILQPGEVSALDEP